MPRAGHAGPQIHSPQLVEGSVKIKLNVDTLAVDSFETCDTAQLGRGTVNAHQQTRACNTRTPFCQTPSVYRPCITDEVECGT